MRSRQEEVKRFEELRHYGTPLDETILIKARAESRGLKITQAGDVMENLAYADQGGGLGLMISLCVENNSDRTIKLTDIRLQMPWADPSFRWLEKQPKKVLNLWAGYVLPACGPYGFDPSLVLNHVLTHSFKLYPGDSIEGLLLGQGTAAVPAEYNARILIPMQLLIFAGPGESYGAWVKVGMVPTVAKKHEVVRPRRVTAAQHTEVSAEWSNDKLSPKTSARGVDARSERDEHENVEPPIAGLE